MKNSIAKNTAVLSMAGFLTKILGAVYKFPLIKILGQEGFGIYSIVYPLFAIFLILGTSAFSLGVSRYISKNQDNIDITSPIILAIIVGSICNLILLFSGKIISLIQNQDEFYFIYKNISPLVIISFLLGSLRGYFQGKEEMKIVAKSQIIEQLIKIISSIVICIFLLKINLIYAVFGLFLGIGLSEFASIIYMLSKIKTKTKITTKNISLHNIKEMFKISLPFYFTSIVPPISQSITSIAILPFVAYFSQTFATKVFGFSSGIISSIINIPLIISTSLSISLLPNITKKYKNKNYFGDDVIVCLYYVFNISIFFTLIFFIFAPEISNTLISLFSFDINEFILTNFFKIASFTIFYSAFLQVINTLLQGLGKWKTTTLFSFLGAIIKFISLYLLTRFESINMYSIFISENVGTAFCLILEIISLKKHFNIYSTNKVNFLKPSILFLSIITCAVILQNYTSINLITTFFKAFIILLLIIIESILLNLFNIRKFIFKNKSQPF